MFGFNEACNWWFEGFFFLGSWAHCCLNHDKIYELGFDKLAGDFELMLCVGSSAAHPFASLLYWVVGLLMFLATSLFGWVWYIKARKEREGKTMARQRTTENGVKLLKEIEGVVHTCYLDSVNVATIYVGFTRHSAVVRRELGKLVPGKTKITKEEGDRILKLMLAEEYEPPVVAGMPNAKPYEFDVGTSVCWNLGPKSMSWNWAKLFRAGKIKAAADYLSKNYNKAGGRVIKGLIRRREREAHLLATGDYGFGGVKAAGAPRKVTRQPKAADPVVVAVQELLTGQGFDPGKIDGWMGQKTKAAVLAYQKTHPHLTNDGVIGPATIAQLQRDSEAVKKVIERTTKTSSIPAVIAGGAAYAQGLPWGYIAGGVVLLALAWFIWANRDIFTRRFNTIRGIEVEV